VIFTSVGRLGYACMNEYSSVLEFSCASCDRVGAGVFLPLFRGQGGDEHDWLIV
jgi:hypothetical protein